MGIFSRLKNLFKKSINLSELDKSHLVALVKNNAKIKFGTPLEVVPGFVAVLSHKNKVADLFAEGKYRLDVPTMPILSRIEKLTKPNKKGDLPKAFYADIYFLNLSVFEKQKFGGANVIIKDKKFKKLKATLFGSFSYQIKSPIDFMEAMFTQFGVLRNSIAKDEISSWVAGLVARKVQKNSPEVYDLYCRDTKCFDGVLDYLNKNLSDVGIMVESVEVTEVKFPKKVYQNVTLSSTEVFEQKQDEKIAIDNKSLNDKLDYEEKVLPASQLQLEIEQAEQKTQDETIYFDGEISSQTSERSNKSLSSENLNTESNADEQIRQTIEYKKCNNCGALNSKESHVCFKCYKSID